MMDDQALVPSESSAEPQVVEDQAIDQAMAEEAETARAYYHPAWANVQKFIDDQIKLLSAPPDLNLIAEEYKIEGVSRMRTMTVLNNLLHSIKSAVEATENAEPRKPRKRSN